MKSSLPQFLIFLVAATVAPAVSGAEPGNSINLGFGGPNPLPHCDVRVNTIEYEHLLTPTIAVLGRGSVVNYRYDDGAHHEEGELRGVDVGARYYPSGGMQGLFMGGSLGYWNGDWTFFEDKNNPTALQGQASFKSLRLNIDLGARILIGGTHISIMPQANLGKFFASNSCEATAPASLAGTTCSEKSEANYYLFLGVAVGVAF